MEGKDKYNIPPPERKESSELRERIRKALDQMETDEGREFLAYKAVCAGELFEPEYVEFALRRAEKIRQGDISKVTEEIKEEFAPFNLPEERYEQIAQNIQGYRESYEKAGKEYRKYMNVEMPKKDQAVLEKAKEHGYDLNPESALRAEEEGNYGLSYLIYLNLPEDKIPDNERVKEIFGDNVIFFGLEDRWKPLFVWARETNNHGYINVIKKRLDERARVWDKLSLARHHSENMIPEYELIGDYAECARRSEGNPPSFFPVSRRIKNVPPQLAQRFKELHELTWTTLSSISTEELKKKVQAQRGEIKKD